MTGRADYGNSRSFDPDATVALPVVTPDSSTRGAHEAGYESQPTVVLPTVPPTGPVPPGEPASPGDGGGSVARNSAVMAALSVVSRVTGFLRTATIGAAIGSAALADDYNLANNLPNMVYELLLGGVLASVVVPLLVRARTNDPDRGEAYAQRLLTLATVFLAVATVAAVAAAPLLTRLMANADTPAADRDLITILGYLLLPEIFFYGVAALLAAILNTRGHFAAPMWTPILNNIVVIATAALYMLLPSTGNSAATISTTQVLVLGVGTTLGIVVQACGLIPALRKVGFRWRWRWDFGALHLGELARIGGWMLGYVLVSQVGVVAALKIAKIAADRAGAPGPAIYLNSYLIFMMAHGIVAVSVLTALMPRMSAAASEGRYADLADQLSLGTRLSSVILVPATAAYLVLGRPLGVTLFDHGDYGHDNAVKTGWVIAVAGLGLVPFAISQLQLGAFYAMPDTRTPALINLPVVALRIAVQWLGLLVLPVVGVAAGLMGGNAISFVFGTVLGYWLLRRRMGRLGLRAVGSTLARLALAAALAAVPAGLAVVGLRAVLADDWLGSVIELVVGGVVLLAGYVAAAVALRVREVTELGGMLRARLGR
ncbi:murein biosynthesis integral membrane protein MurJ [Planosporangium mesophilum]|uniref:Lipid II flippase MurJ n=1 Tax=Planosporangium mesophilum TaxID=689768 RepID=A0A8J3TCE4_9ACTN|nr:murein biosynthesis integral membrane protein MurJ [Planosporangium mesophilum]NJC82239.1 murein biosynthesis integral membrane protein MurJ [Planosporangium mesophilum]GII22289.1 lipid II flippase MurJ [Planosporangium mesophilum]